MLIDHVITMCDRRYGEHVFASHPCNHCGQPERCESNIARAKEKNEPHGCFQCCYDIHYCQNGGRTDYSCDHLFNYYLCRYSCKYCSEILYALETIDLSQYPMFNLISLGCGPSPDLMAFDYLHDRGLPQKNIFYLGCDINKGWANIHNCIREYSLNRGYSVNYLYYDVMDLLTNRMLLQGYNVVIVQYLISHFINTKQKVLLKSFFGGIIEKFVAVKATGSPLLIVLNDIDHYKARNHFYRLAEMLREQGYHIKVNAKHFKDKLYLKNSTQYYSQANKFNCMPDFVRRYSCALECTSVQLIIEVE